MLVVVFVGSGITVVFLEVFEDVLDAAGIEDEGDDSHVGTTPQTAKRLDLEDALQEVGPS